MENTDQSQETGSKNQRPPTDPGREARRWVQRNDTRVEKVVDILEANLGVPRHPGDREPLQVLVVTILSQNTTDPTALRAYLNLMERFPDQRMDPRDLEKLPHDDDGNIDAVKIRMSQVADAFPPPDWSQIHHADPGDLEDAISVCGLQQSKTATIQRALQWVHDRTGGYDLSVVLDDLPPAKAARTLSEVKGVGVKTAAVTLMEAKEVDICPVDTHVHRVCQRLRLVPPSKSRDKTFRDLQPLIPDGKGYSLHHNLLTFGRTICTARNPRCEECYLRRVCHYYRNENRGEDLTVKFVKE